MEKNWKSTYMVKAFAHLPFDVMLQQKINAIYRDDSGRFDIYRRACGGSVGPVMIRCFARFLKRGGYLAVINTGGNVGGQDFFSWIIFPPWAPYRRPTTRRRACT